MKKNTGNPPVVYVLLLSLSLVVPLAYAGYYLMAEIDIFSPGLRVECPVPITWNTDGKMKYALVVAGFDFHPAAIVLLVTAGVDIIPSFLNPPPRIPLRC